MKTHRSCFFVLSAFLLFCVGTNAQAGKSGKDGQKRSSLSRLSFSSGSALDSDNGDEPLTEAESAKHGNQEPLFQVFRDARSRAVYIKGSDPQELSAEIEAIRAWTLRFEGASSASNDPILMEAVEISSLLPDRVEALYEFNPQINGPNSFNWALYLQKLTPHLRHTDADEFGALVSLFCRPRVTDTEQKPRPGDLGIIRSRNRTRNSSASEVWDRHAFTYIRKTAATRLASETRPGYQIVTLDEVLDTFTVDRKPECRLGLHPEPETCETFVQYFYCAPEYGSEITSHPEYITLMNTIRESRLEENFEIEALTGEFHSPIQAQTTQLRKIKGLIFSNPAVSALQDSIYVSFRKQINSTRRLFPQ